MDTNCQHPRTPIDKKQGKGTLLRVYHYAESKLIPPLASLAEIKTVTDTCGNGVATMGHLWWEYRQPGWIKCREYACLTCINCRQQKFSSCVCGTARVNTVRTCQVKFLHSNKRVEEKETGKKGVERSRLAKPGDLIGAECANDTEPYIVCEVVRGFDTWTGEDGKSWMGKITAGDEYIVCNKYEKRGADCLYTEMKKEFYLLATDTRIIFHNHKKIERKRETSARSSKGASDVKMYMLDSDELQTLKCRVYMRSRDNA